MRTFLTATVMLLLIIPSPAQSVQRFRISGHPSITGAVEEETETRFTIRDDTGKLITIPKSKIISHRPYKAYLDSPGYDQNRNDFYLGLEWGYNQTFGQEKQNFIGYSIFGRAGYDWNHRYAMEIKTGINNMNFTGIHVNNDSSSEVYIPVLFSVKKYLTRNRHLLYLHLSHGYSWGLTRTNPEQDYWEPDLLARELKHRGAGPVIMPGIGVRRIGKYGQDYELQLGVHLQQMHSINGNPEELYSELNIIYRRWTISYGVLF